MNNYFHEQPSYAEDPVDVEYLRLESMAWSECEPKAKQIREAVKAFDKLLTLESYTKCREYAALALALACQRNNVKVSEALEWIGSVDER